MFAVKRWLRSVRLADLIICSRCLPAGVGQLLLIAVRGRTAPDQGAVGGRNDYLEEDPAGRLLAAGLHGLHSCGHLPLDSHIGMIAVEHGWEAPQLLAACQDKVGVMAR